MKYYARQIDPANQTSPFDARELFDDDTIIILGNRFFSEYYSDNSRLILRELESGECSVSIDEVLEGDFRWFDSVRDVVETYFPNRGRRGKYSEEEIDRLAEIAGHYGEYPEELAEVMSIVTGNRWEHKTIRGSVQGDWQDVYFDTSAWSADAILDLEVEYFNTGEEWCVTTIENDDDFRSPYGLFTGIADSEVCEYVYTHRWMPEDQREEIARYLGIEPQNVVLKDFSGYTYIERWTVNEA